MAYSIINVSRRKPKTRDHLTRLQDYIERKDNSRTATEPAAWTSARDDLRLSLTADNFTRWIAPLQARDEDGQLILEAPTEFDRRWLESKLDPRIRQSLDRTGNGHLQPQYEVGTPPALDPDHPRSPRIIMSRDDWAAYTMERLDDLGLKQRLDRQGGTLYNSPLAIHYTLTTSRAWLEEHPEQREAWIEHSYGFVRDLHGEAQLLGGAVHEHQATLHLHVAAIPIDARGRLSASSFTRTREQLEALHTTYNRYLRARDLQLERGQNARLERQMAAASPEVRRTAVLADDIPLHEILERLEAERDGRDPRRWTIGDRLIQVHDDGHGFTEMGPHGVDDGRGAIDLVVRLRQEGQTPIAQHGLAVGYLAAIHPERVLGTAPPLVPPVPEHAPHAPSDRQSISFGQQSRWEPGQFIIVDSLREAATTAASAKGWGRIAVVEQADTLPLGELDEAIGKGWMIDVASTSDTVWDTIQQRYSEHTKAQGQQIWRTGATPAKAAEHAMDKEQSPVMGPEMMMG